MDKVTNVPGVTSVKVKLTYEPRWTPEMMSPEAKAPNGMLSFFLPEFSMAVAETFESIASAPGRVAS